MTTITNFHESYLISFASLMVGLCTCTRTCTLSTCAISVFYKHFHSTRVANIKWVYISYTMATLEASFNSGSKTSHKLSEKGETLRHQTHSAEMSWIRSSFGPKCPYTISTVHIHIFNGSYIVLEVQLHLSIRTTKIALDADG